MMTDVDVVPVLSETIEIFKAPPEDRTNRKRQKVLRTLQETPLLYISKKCVQKKDVRHPKEEEGVVLQHSKDTPTIPRDTPRNHY